MARIQTYERYLIVIPIVSLLLTSYSCLVVLPERRRHHREIEQKFDARLDGIEKRLERTDRQIRSIMDKMQQDIDLMGRDIENLKANTSRM